MPISAFLIGPPMPDRPGPSRGNGTGTAFELRVFGLWNHDLDEGRRLARAAHTRGKGRTRVVLARLVGDRQRLPSLTLRELREEKVTVVPVSNRFAGSGDDNPALIAAVRKRLQEQAQLLALQRRTAAPATDPSGARAVAHAVDALPPATEAERRRFLDAFYGDEAADDGVR